MEDGEPYRNFIAVSAKELAALPDNTRAMLSGRGFFPLTPHFFEKVRQGQSRFGLTCDRIYDDLFAAYLREQQSLDRRLIRKIAGRIRAILFQLRLWFFVLFPRARGRKRLFSRRGPPALPARSSARSAKAVEPNASIVILSYDRLPYLRNTLAALIDMTGEAPYELIAVDNGSSDGSVEFLEDAHRTGLVSKLLLLDENQGISAGYNLGFAMADEHSRFFVKLDSDLTLLTRDWLTDVMEFMTANERVGFVAPNQINDTLLALLPMVRFGGRDVMDFGQWQLGSSMVISKRLRDDIGCFIEDPQMTFVPDDIDYYVRASRKGYRPLYMRDFRVYHQWELDMSNYQAYTLGKPRDASIQLALQLARDYDRGIRPLEVHYEKYQPSR